MLLDVSPREAVRIAGRLLPRRYRERLERFRYGPGAFKLDLALDGPIPWTAPECQRAATVHLGGSLEVSRANACTTTGSGLVNRGPVALV